MKKTVEALFYMMLCSLFFCTVLLTVVWLFNSRTPSASGFLPLLPIVLLLAYIIFADER